MNLDEATKVNPLISESRIIELIDQAETRRAFYYNLRRKPPPLDVVRIKIGRKAKYFEFSGCAGVTFFSHRGNFDDLVAFLFDLSLRNYYISNVVCTSYLAIQLNLKLCLHGRNTNYGAATLEKLLSVVGKSK